METKQEIINHNTTDEHTKDYIYIDNTPKAESVTDELKAAQHNDDNLPFNSYRASPTDFTMEQSSATTSSSHNHDPNDQYDNVKMSDLQSPIIINGKDIEFSDIKSKSGRATRTFPYNSCRAKLRDLKFPNSIDIFLPLSTNDGGMESKSSTPLRAKFVKRSQSYSNLNPKYLLENLLKDK